jgi:hypothetical protein
MPAIVSTTRSADSGCDSARGSETTAEQDVQCRHRGRRQLVRRDGQRRGEPGRAPPPGDLGDVRAVQVPVPDAQALHRAERGTGRNGQLDRRSPVRQFGGAVQVRGRPTGEDAGRRRDERGAADAQGHGVGQPGVGVDAR